MGVTNSSFGLKEAHDLIELETELTLRGMSQSTKESYCKYNAQFLSFTGKDASKIG